MIMTRDNDDAGMIVFWKHGSKVRRSIGDLWWASENARAAKYCCGFFPKEFKKAFPGKRLPRKGSKTTVRKRDYFGRGKRKRDLVQGLV